MNHYRGSSEDSVVVFDVLARKLGRARSRGYAALQGIIKLGNTGSEVGACKELPSDGSTSGSKFTVPISSSGGMAATLYVQKQACTSNPLRFRLSLQLHMPIREFY